MNKQFSTIIELFKSGIESVKPSKLLVDAISLDDDLLKIKSFQGFETEYDLSKYKNVFIIGAGKASALMALEIEKILGKYISSGIVVTKYGFGEKLNKIEMLEAAHPIPDNESYNAAKRISEFCKSAGKNDLIINLLSGGASALLAMPVKEISLEEKIKVTELLLKCGASISEINLIRKSLSQIKGGGLLNFTNDTKLVSLILSDVIGDDITTIGSGITAYEEKHFSQCIAIIDKYKLDELLPVNVKSFFEKWEKPPNIKRRTKTAEVDNIIIGNNVKAINTVKTNAEKLGYDTRVITTTLEGEASVVGSEIAKTAIKFIKENNIKTEKYCFLYAGETTVIIKGSGAGGRNQELVLAAAIEVEGKEKITILSGGTDGNDGPTDAAGAVCNGESITIAKNLGLDSNKYLMQNDSYNFFDKINGLIKTGPSGTNVMDIQIVLIN